MSTYIVYTDGSSLGNPGPGGYGVVIKYGDERQEFSYGYRKTTNNRMEMLAAAIALENIPEGSDVMLHSDSKLLIDAFNKNWINGWQKRGWKKADKSKVLNIDLWKKIIEAMKGKTVKFVWVKGHDGIPENERCDVLGRTAAGESPTEADIGYEGEADSSLFNPPEEEDTFVPETRRIDKSLGYNGKDRNYNFSAQEIVGIGTFIEMKIQKGDKEKSFFIGKDDLQGVIDALKTFL